MAPVLVAGLGNPGSQYAKTRHNIGFMVADELVRRTGGSLKSVFNAAVADVRLGGNRVLVMKPTTYMNLSGGAVRPCMDYFDIDIENLLVIHDDVDMPFGRMKLKKGGRSGGQKGVQNIIDALSGDMGFARLKLGVGKHPRLSTKDWVLKDFTKTETEHLEDFVTMAADCVEAFVEKGLREAMTAFNNKTATPDDWDPGFSDENGKKTP